MNTSNFIHVALVWLISLLESFCGRCLNSVVFEIRLIVISSTFILAEIFLIRVLFLLDFAHFSHALVASDACLALLRMLLLLRLGVVVMVLLASVFTF